MAPRDRASTAREHVRVALRLREFPATRDRFAAGTLSYSKVRSITRCGDPSCEDLLLTWADDATAAQLESVARGFRTAERARRDAAVHEEEPDAAFSTRARTFGDGTRELTLRGPAELVAELERAVERLAEHAVAERTGRAGPGPDGTAPHARADADRPGADADQLGGDAETGRTDDARPDRGDADTDRAGREAEAGRTDDARPDQGDADTDRGDADTDRAEREASDPAGAHDDLPDTAPPSPRVSARDRVEAAVDAVVAAAAAGTPPDTSGLDRHTLVLHVAADDLASPPAADDAPEEHAPEDVDRDGASAGAPRTDRRIDVVAASDPTGRVRGMDRSTLRRLACEAGITLVATGEGGTPIDVGRRRRRTTAALRRAVHRRDRDRCTFPGCPARRHLHAHHVEHWIDGGPTDLANLVLVCGFHHRFVHAAGWSIEVRPDGRHRYRPPGGAVVERIPRPPDGDARTVTSAAPPTASAGALLPPTHLGGPFDLDVAVATLQRHHELARRSLDLAA